MVIIMVAMGMDISLVVAVEVVIIVTIMVVVAMLLLVEVTVGEAVIVVGMLMEVVGTLMAEAAVGLHNSNYLHITNHSKVTVLQVVALNSELATGYGKKKIHSLFTCKVP
jgi:hypothetical protein